MAAPGVTGPKREHRMNARRGQGLCSSGLARLFTLAKGVWSKWSPVNENCLYRRREYTKGSYPGRDPDFMKALHVLGLLLVAWQALPSEDVYDYLENKSIPQMDGRISPEEWHTMLSLASGEMGMIDGPDPNPEHAALESGSPYYILMYRDEYLRPLLNIARDRSLNDGYRVAALFALSNLAGNNLPELNFESLKGLAEQIEDETAGVTGKSFSLTLAYEAMARSGTPEALAFLMQRASFEFWQGRAMPRVLFTPKNPTWWNAQGEALRQIAQYGSPEAEAFLQACASDPRYTNDAVLKAYLNFDKDFLPEFREDDQARELAWKIRGEMLHSKAPPLRVGGG